MSTSRRCRATSPVRASRLPAALATAPRATPTAASAATSAPRADSAWASASSSAACVTALDPAAPDPPRAATAEAVAGRRDDHDLGSGERQVERGAPRRVDQHRAGEQLGERGLDVGTRAPARSSRAAAFRAGRARPAPASARRRRAAARRGRPPSARASAACAAGHAPRRPHASRRRARRRPRLRRRARSRGGRRAVR